MRKQLFRLAAISALAAASSFAATLVSVELQLLVDVSGSISDAEYLLQRDGYAAAFLDPSVIANIENAEGGIAVQMIHWAGKDSQKIVIDWTHLTSAADAAAFAASIQALPRTYRAGLTGVQGALAFGAPLFASNDFEGARKITDVSGDGYCNDPGVGICGSAGHDAMKAAGVTVNGLVIGGSASVKNYYLNNVLTNGGKLYEAKTLADFESVIRTKIYDETSSVVPEPSTWAMVVTGLAGLMISVRRRKAA